MSSVDEARKSAETSLEEVPEDVLAYLLEDLWDQLINARRSSMSGEWSIACDGVVHRIVWLTKHTQQPTGWGSVPVELVLDGTYEAIHEAIGMPTPISADDRVKAQEHYEKYVRPRR